MTEIVHTSVEVQERDGILVVDSRLIAERLGIAHDNFLQTLEKHKASIQEAFGVFLFETGKPPLGSKGGRPEKYALLTEEQATVLMTLSRNTPQVVALKIALVKAFTEAKAKLSSAQIQHLLFRANDAHRRLDAVTSLLEMYETIRIDTRSRLEDLEAAVFGEPEALPQALPIASGMMTIRSYAIVHNLTLSQQEVLAYSVKAKMLSHANGVKVGKVLHERYGSINAYHEDILKVVFSQPV